VTGIDGTALHGVYAKIARAGEHLHALRTETDAFLESGALRVMCEDEGEWKVFRHRQLPGFPPKLGVIVGDYIHNLRSALDHLAWQLVLAAGSKPGGWTYFPLFRSKHDFKAKVVSPLGDRKSPVDGIDTTSPMFTLIESCQPYHGWKNNGDPETHHLFWLSLLSRIDKHRVVHTRHAFPDPEKEREYIESITWNPDAVLLEQRDRPDILEPFENGTEIVAFRFDPNAAEPNMQVPAHFPIVVAFGSDTHACGFKGLADIRENVVDVVGAFKKFFP
jgi:hypothetical protein